MKSIASPNDSGISRFLLSGFLLAAANPVHGQTTSFWDADGNTSAATGGSGVWDTGSSLWRTDTATGPLAVWSNAEPNADTAQFAGTAGIITLNSSSVTININRIVFGTTGYEIAGPISGTATLNLSGSAPTINTGTSITATISSPISGSTGLTKTGAGTLNLTGSNSYTGATTVSSGTVSVAGNQSAADGGWAINGNSSVTFQAGSTIDVAAGRNVTFANGGDARSLTVLGTVTTSGSSNLTIRGRSTLNINNGGSWTQGGALTIQPLNSGFGANLTVRTGGSFTYEGSSNITLAKSTSGGTGSANLNLNGGTFTTSRGISNANAGTGSGSTNLNFTNGGTLKLSADITALIIEGSSAFNVSTGTGGGVIDTNGFNTTIDVEIAGAGGLTKSGAGTLSLGGNHSYTGSTLVSAGTLLINGALSADSAVTVDPLASIGGTGLISGALTIAANSLFTVADVNDPLAVTGTITIGSGFGIGNLLGINWDELDLETPYSVISTTQTFAADDLANFGRANAVNVGSNGRQAYFTNGSLAVVVIPEPSAALLGGLGLLALLRRRRTT